MTEMTLIFSVISKSFQSMTGKWPKNKQSWSDHMTSMECMTYLV